MQKCSFTDTAYFKWRGYAPLYDVELIPTESKFNIPPEVQARIDREWGDYMKENPQAFDAGKWREEHVHYDGKKLHIYVSPTTYSAHNILRHDPPPERGDHTAFYPNPLTVHPFLETLDGYLPVSLTGRTSDQPGKLTLPGSGFIERYEGDENPEPVVVAVVREVLEEVHFTANRNFSMNRAKAIAIITGRNHETTISCYLPTLVTHDQMHLNGTEEITSLLFIPNSREKVYQVLKIGKFEDVEILDVTSGALEQYLHLKDTGVIVSEYQHE